MREKPLLLVVEDDRALSLGLEENLKFAGYDVIVASDGQTGIRRAESEQPDLIILDLMLPGLSGYEVCRRLRLAGASMPIVILTARQDEFDKLHGFELGADDYVTKPFSVKELLARVRTILLRGQRRIGGPTRYEFGNCLLDVESRTLRRHIRDRPRRFGKKPPADSDEGKWEEVILTRTEFDLLAYFCAHEGKALSREQILNDVWGTKYSGTQRSLDTFVASLRSKIEETPGNPRHIVTLHGVGYKFLK